MICPIGFISSSLTPHLFQPREIRGRLNSGNGTTLSLSLLVLHPLNKEGKNKCNPRTEDARKERELEKNPVELPKVPAKDYRLKEGEKIKVKIGKVGAGTGGML